MQTSYFESFAPLHLLSHLNKYGFALGTASKYKLLDEVGEHFLDHAIELVKAVRKFVCVG